MIHCISSSGGLSLRFPDDDLYQEYLKAEELLNVRAYAAVRDRYGIWAGYQNKFVQSREEMNDWDSKYMEDLYDKYKKEGKI